MCQPDEGVQLLEKKTSVPVEYMYQMVFFLYVHLDLLDNFCNIHHILMHFYRRPFFYHYWYWCQKSLISQTLLAV